MKYAKTTISAALMALTMAISSGAYSQPIDAAPGATESASDATENPTDLATTKPETAEVAPATEESDPSEAPAEENQAKEDPADTASGIYSAFANGHWLVAIGGILMFLVWFLRAVVFGKIEWFGTKKGGFILSLATSVALGVGAALFGGAEFGVGLVGSIVMVKYAAAGGWGHVKDVFNL